MKLLSIDNGSGQYLAQSGEYLSVEKITKEDLLRLVNLTLQEDVEFDAYDEKVIKNQAHQIVYKSVYEKLRDLKNRRKAFVDESERLFLEDYEKYQKEIT